MSHITLSQRNQLQALKRAGHTQSEIAKIVGFSQSTISRELKRNGFKWKYTANTAQQRAEERRKKAYSERPKWWNNEQLLHHVEGELRDRKSPDQIAGRMKQQKWEKTVSHQSIYAYIKFDKDSGRKLYKYLRYQGKRHKWRGINADKTGIPNRKGIEKRPEIVREKKRCGDWESDLVMSKKEGKGAIATFVERLCMYFRAVLIERPSADEMVRATHEALDDIPKNLRHTMTHDNGKEISKHEQITQEMEIDIYCGRPYCSCDRGLNEFMNRELRRFFPKGTDFSIFTQQDIDVAVEWLNNCPRRSLKYRTPKEAFEEQLQIMHFTL